MDNPKKRRQTIVFVAAAGGILLVGLLAFVLMHGLDSGGPLPPTTKHPTPTTRHQPSPQAGQVFLYETLPGAHRSSISVRANGQDIFVEQYKDSNYARFAFSGTVMITIASPDAVSYTISPRRYDIKTIRNGDEVSFSLDAPRDLVLQGSKEKLFLFASAPEEKAPQVGDSNVIDVTKYVTDKSGQSVQTVHIQQAIDEAGNRHGIVYFPKGVYASGTLNMRSNASLYLSSGALLSGSSEAKDFSQQFIAFEHVSNAKIYGPGVIDLHGMALRQQAGDQGRIKIVRTMGGSAIELRDVVLRDAGSWTVHLLGSDQVTVSNIKIINDLNNTNGDGIDPDGASHVTIDRAFIYTSDDCFAVKTSGTFGILQPVRNVVVKNAVCYTKKSALKVGTETRAALSDITFEQNDVVHADRAIALYMVDGSVMENIKYIGNTSETIEGNSKQRLIDIAIGDRKGIGQIKNVQIIDYTAYEASPRPSSITGLDGHAVDVVIKNMSIAGHLCTSIDQADIKMENAGVSLSAVD